MLQSAGLVVFRRTNGFPEFFLVHPGGPFWKNKDEQSWSIPKGEFRDDEEPKDAALREFQEETGLKLTNKKLYELKPVQQKSGKRVKAWMVEQDLDEAAVKSNLFEMQWPPKSGRMQQFPEVDRGGWFKLEEAKKKILAGQDALLDQVIALIEGQA